MDIMSCQRNVTRQKFHYSSPIHHFLENLISFYFQNIYFLCVKLKKNNGYTLNSKKKKKILQKLKLKTIALQVTSFQVANTVQNPDLIHIQICMTSQNDNSNLFRLPSRLETLKKEEMDEGPRNIYTEIILEFEVVFPKSESSRTLHKAEWVNVN